MRKATIQALKIRDYTIAKGIPEERQRWARCWNCRCDYVKEVGDKDVFCPPCDIAIFGKEYLPEKRIRNCRVCKNALPADRYFYHYHCERVIRDNRTYDMEVL